MILARPDYLSQLVGKMGNSMVKVVTGLRRSGKSFLLFTIFKEHLSKKIKNIS
ncbi:MAG: AAA family ATPase [Treponema sp.]|nr:AAA family ATPase [Treponema sp.]